jgi:signal transduction histidine kinase
MRVSTRCIDDWAEIRIQDTGCGIPLEIRAGEASVRNSKRDSREMAFCGICDTESTRS